MARAQPSVRDIARRGYRREYLTRQPHRPWPEQQEAQDARRVCRTFGTRAQGVQLGQCMDCVRTEPVRGLPRGRFVLAGARGRVRQQQSARMVCSTSHAFRHPREFAGQLKVHRSNGSTPPAITACLYISIRAFLHKSSSVWRINSPARHLAHKQVAAAARLLVIRRTTGHAYQPPRISQAWSSRLRVPWTTTSPRRRCPLAASTRSSADTATPVSCVAVSCAGGCCSAPWHRARRTPPRIATLPV